MWTSGVGEEAANSPQQQQQSGFWKRSPNKQAPLPGVITAARIPSTPTHSLSQSSSGAATPQQRDSARQSEEKAAAVAAVPAALRPEYFASVVRNKKLASGSGSVESPPHQQPQSSAAVSSGSERNSNSNSNGPTASDGAGEPRYSKAAVKRRKLNEALAEKKIDLKRLRELCWGGIPMDLRPLCWKILLGYIPTQQHRRQQTLQRKRKEYIDLLPQYDVSERSEYEQGQLKQIHMDIPRLHLQQKVFLAPTIQKSLERLLYLWSLRHPVVGYVQGFNDLATVFYSVYLIEHVGEGADWETLDPDEVLSADVLMEVEADTFWSLGCLIDGIQDAYTSDRRGLFRMITTIREVVEKTDPALWAHLKEEGLGFELFTTSWINCLLMRSFPLHLVWRMYDTYFSEGGDNVATFHPYVCAAFLKHWSATLRKLGFQEALLFIQNPPTQKWGTDEMELLLSQAFMYQSLYQNASAHLHTNK